MVARLTADAAEKASHQDLSVGLQGYGEDVTVRVWIEGCVERAVWIEPSNSVARNGRSTIGRDCGELYQRSKLCRLVGRRCSEPLRSGLDRIHQARIDHSPTLRHPRPGPRWKIIRALFDFGHFGKLVFAVVSAMRVARSSKGLVSSIGNASFQAEKGNRSEMIPIRSA